MTRMGGPKKLLSLHYMFGDSPRLLAAGLRKKVIDWLLGCYINTLVFLYCKMMSPLSQATSVAEPTCLRLFFPQHII